MDAESAADVANTVAQPTARGYQQELLQESLRRNIVIALDTGSGKTLIAILRMKHETERTSDKISWFLAPTVALIKQQRDAIQSHIPVQVGLISGDEAPDQWKDATLWSDVLKKNRIIVSTPQVLLDALSHGYVRLETHISLLVFDEAHHAVSKHPYNEIMKRFYHPLSANKSRELPIERPAILGLSASPIYGGQMQKAFRDLEHNLDSVVLSSRYNREELATYVHKPEFKYETYSTPNAPDIVGCTALASLQAVISEMNIEDDPYVISLRSQLAKMPAGKERDRVDQRLSKTLDKKDSFSHKGMRDFARTAEDLCIELGPWAANWYITSVLERARTEAGLQTGVMASWRNGEKRYLLMIIDKVQLLPISYDPAVIRAGISDKVHCVIRSLLKEEESFREQDEPYSGIVFVTRRDAVITLGKILSSLPETSEKFRVGCLLGTSSNFKRHAFMDISRTLLQDNGTKTLNDFRVGEKNLLVSTSVAEEGLDIQACGSVVRFDPPPNMVAWAQSRGRARRQKSTFVVLLDERELASHSIHTWHDLERTMVAYYNNQARSEQEELEDDLLENDLKLEVKETGATLTLQNAMGHLHHFCAVLTRTVHVPLLPLFDLDPPEYEKGWHSLELRSSEAKYEGPWGSTCTLPRQVPAHLRVFQTERIYPTKRSAYNHAAFLTYKRLYEEGDGLINNHLLPGVAAAVELLKSDVEKRLGTANVANQMDPWLVPKGPEMWWSNEVEIEGLPRLFIFTRRELPKLTKDEMLPLNDPQKGSLSVDVVSTAVQVTDESIVAAARAYTRRIFTILHEKQMDPDKSDFCYLFLPLDEVPSEDTWSRRRDWMRERLASGVASQTEGENRANVETFQGRFGLAADITLVRGHALSTGKKKREDFFRFVGWNEGPLFEEDEKKLRARYEGVPGFEIKYPLIIAEDRNSRANFLAPILDPTMSNAAENSSFLLLPQFTTIYLATPEDVQFASYLPSVLRALSFAMTVRSLRNALLSHSPNLNTIPFSLLRTAMTAPVTQEPVNYERLETLGDCVLKYLTSIQLFSQYHLWHEGFLARRKDHAVSNQQLAKAAIEKGLQTWMIRDTFTPRRWRPKYTSDPIALAKPAQDAESTEKAEAEGVSVQPAADADGDRLASDVVAGANTQAAEAAASGTKSLQTKPKKKKKKQAQGLSTKMLADVVESLLGASYEHGGFDLATECVRTFGLGVDRWDTVSTCIDNALSRVETIYNLPPELSLVETMIGYKFSRPALLVEALTHGSYTGDLGTVSYERLEFIGDAVLDMIVTDFLYHAPGRAYKPGHMHIRKESLVNAHILAFICLSTYVDIDASMPVWNAQNGVAMTRDTQRIYLYRCMLHSSPRVLDDLNVTFTRFEKQEAQIRQVLLNGDTYPWAALTSLQSPKFISDMFESILGAVFLDSQGNLDVVRGMLDNLGLKAVMDRVISDNVEVLHPISRLYIWAAQGGKKCDVQVVNDKAKGTVTCIVKIDDVEEFRATEVSRGQTSMMQVRFAAAEGALLKLKIREQESAEDVEEEEEEREEQEERQVEDILDEVNWDTIPGPMSHQRPDGL